MALMRPTAGHPEHPCAKFAYKSALRLFLVLHTQNMADEVATAEETPGAEEVSNPDAPAAESKEESNEPNDDAKTGVKYKGVVNWFNVAKGFGELAIPLVEVLFSRSPRPRPSVPTGPAGSSPDFLSPECKHHSLLWHLTVTPGPGATASPFTHRARPRQLRGKKSASRLATVPTSLGKLIPPSRAHPQAS